MSSLDGFFETETQRLARWRAQRPLCACGCGELVPFEAARAEQRARWSLDYPFATYRPGHQFRRFDPTAELSERARAFIWAGLLGDGSILYPSQASAYPRYRRDHGLAQAWYAKRLAREMTALRPVIVYGRPKRLWRATHFCAELTTSCHPFLAEVRDAFYAPAPPPIRGLPWSRRGVKRITEAVAARIDPFALALWFMDDGSGGRHGARFHTEGFDSDSLALLSERLHALGICNHLERSRRYWRIALPKRGRDALESLIGSYLFGPFRYKLGYAPEAPEPELRDDIEGVEERLGPTPARWAWALHRERLPFRRILTFLHDRQMPIGPEALRRVLERLETKFGTAAPRA